MSTTKTPFKDYINIPRVSSYPPEYNLLNSERYQISQAIIDYETDKPSDVYYIFYDKIQPSNTKLLDHEDELTKDYYSHLEETVSIIKSTWKDKTGNDVDPKVDLYKLLQLNVEEHIHRAKIISECEKLN